MGKKGKPVIGVTLGDAAGIGPEVTARAAANGTLAECGRPLIIGDEGLLRLGMKTAGADFAYRTVSGPEEVLSGGPPDGDAVYVLDTRSVDTGALKLGEVSAANGREEGDRLADCVNYCGKGLIDGFCFAPLNKAAMKTGGYNYPSEHELFADLYGLATYYSEMNVLGRLWNIRVTSHIPLKEVAERITVENILRVSILGHETLRKAGFENPRFAVAALNPHAGDSGTCGDEETTVIAEAVRLLREKGVSAEGPFPADTVFIRAFRGDFDGVITMYHDQGQIAIKLKGFEHAVTVSAGMPHPITTPAHGTAYDIAGRGTAGSSTFEDAYRLCARMAANAGGYD
jgi:4-hydroxythreonine-4-phosphate dehydrogenase